MTFTTSQMGLRDLEYNKFIDTNSAGSIALKMCLYALSGTNWLPVRCANDGTLFTSGA